MQINGRLHLSLKLPERDVNFEAPLNLKESIEKDIETQAEEMAARIMERVRQRSKAKSACKISLFPETQKSQHTQQNHGGHMRSESGFETWTATEQKIEPKPEQKRDVDVGDLKTPLKSKSISTLSIRKEQKESTQKKFQKYSNYYLADGRCEAKIEGKTEGQNLLRMIDNVHNLVKKTSIVYRNQYQATSPLKDQSKTDNSKSQLTVKNSFQSPVQKVHKRDIVSQLLSSLKNTKKAKDEFSKKYL